jgi:thiamine transporter ThiT
MKDILGIGFLLLVVAVIFLASYIGPYGRGTPFYAAHSKGETIIGSIIACLVIVCIILNLVKLFIRVF